MATVLADGSLFVLHPQDEIPLVRSFSNNNKLSFVNHSCKGVKENQISLGIVFRSTMHLCEVNKKTGYVFSRKSDSARNKADNEVVKYIHDERKKEDEDRISYLWSRCKDKYSM
jgi:hypothetical protein